MKKNKRNHDLFSKLRKYFAVSKISFKEILISPQKLRTTAIIVPFRIGVMVLIYSYAFKFIGREINGIDANIAVWSIAIYHVLLFVQFRALFKTINDEIRRGSLETQLTKPFSYLIYKVAEQLGKGFPNLIISLSTAFPILFIATGGVPSTFSLSNLLGFLCLAVGGTLVSCVLYLLTVLPAFWIDDAMPFYWIVDKSILILGGSYIPIVLMPQLLQKIANISPFGAPMFATQMFNPNFSNIWVNLFTIQIIWFSILLFLVNIIFTKAQAKLSVNGG